MSKHLHLLRHAKSEWTATSNRDHDRPLAERGEEAADLIGHRLALEAFSPDLVLCSSALRARQTLSRVADSGGFTWPTLYDEALYGADAQALLAAIAAVDPAVNSLLLVGHNPGLQDLALALSSRGDASLKDRLAHKVPTGAFIEITIDVNSFGEITEGSGTLRRFMRPKHEFL